MTTPIPEGSEPFVVRIDAELRPLIDGFLQKRRAEAVALRGAVETGDLETLRVAGHNLKGVGGGYGFHALTDLGRELEACAGSGDMEECRRLVEAVVDYLTRVRPTYTDHE